MSGRRDSHARDHCRGEDTSQVTLETDGEGGVRRLTDGAAVAFRHRDEPIVGASIDQLEADGVFTEGTAERYRAAREQLPPAADATSVSFRAGLRRDGDLDPIEYRVGLEPLPERTGTRWELAEVGLPGRDAVLDQLQQATAEISARGTVRNVFGSLERWVSILLGATGVDVRRSESAQNELLRLSRRGATTPVDDRAVVGETASPYNRVWPAGGTAVLGDGFDGEFHEVALLSIGTRGVLAIGRVGKAVSDADVCALETLAESAATAIKAVEYRSLVNDQRAELDRYETLVESIPDPVYSTDANGRITFVNHAFERAFGYQLEECRGMHITEFTTADSAEKVREEIRQFMDPDSEGYSQLSATGVKADGRTCELSASIGVVYHDEKFKGLVGVMRDVTERERQEQISAVMNRALRHNLRTSTNNIIGYAELAQQGTGKTEEHMDVIREEGEWLMKLGNTLRAVRRSIDGDDEGVMMSVRELVDPLAAEYRSQYPDVEISTRYDCTENIQGGSTLQVAVDNVLENAIVHNDSADPRVDVRTEAVDDCWIAVRIADNGSGISDQQRDLVMGDTEITQLQHGTGIGLWLTRWIVEIFQGEIDIESEDGTVVTLRLQRVED